jgi:hypothetical protein
MELEELLASVHSTSERLRVSEHPEKLAVASRLGVSAQHVAASRLGATLYEDPQLLDSQNGVVVRNGALVMVFGCGLASVDLCASALLRWAGHPPSKNDHDFEDLRRMVKEDDVALTSPEMKWYESVLGTREGKDLRDFRHAVVHRVIRRDINVVVHGPTTTKLSPDVSRPGHVDDVELTDRTAGFVEARWKEFWTNLRP